MAQALANRGWAAPLQPPTAAVPPVAARCIQLAAMPLQDLFALDEAAGGCLRSPSSRVVGENGGSRP